MESRQLSVTLRSLPAVAMLTLASPHLLFSSVSACDLPSSPPPQALQPLFPSDGRHFLLHFTPCPLLPSGSAMPVAITKPRAQWSQHWSWQCPLCTRLGGQDALLPSKQTVKAVQLNYNASHVCNLKFSGNHINKG